MEIQIAYRCALVLKDLVSPYLLRRSKADVAQHRLAAGKTEQVLFCNLSRDQRRAYEEYLDSDEMRRILAEHSRHREDMDDWSRQNNAFR